MKIAGLLAAAVLALTMSGLAQAAHYRLLHASYDATRELFAQINPAFSAFYRQQTGHEVTISQSHGGSAVQARSVVDGMPADIVSLSIELDIDYIASHSNLIEHDWAEQLPNHAAPFTSAIIFLVRRGNPRQIRDWDDLIAEGVEVITPNPRTSAIARYNYLAAYAYADEKFGGGEEQIRGFMRALYAHVPVLDTAVRGATNTFVNKQVGDVLLTWESEAQLALRNMGADQYEIVVPSVSIIASPRVAVVTANARAHGTLEVARAYAEFLYSDQAQEIMAANHYRPANAGILGRHRRQFVELELVDAGKYGGLQRFGERHFADGGEFEKLMGDIHK